MAAMAGPQCSARDSRHLLRHPLPRLMARVGCLFLLAAILVTGLVTAVDAEQPTVPPPSLPEGWTRVVADGFGNPANSHIVSTAEFNGRLYVSTMTAAAGQLISGAQQSGAEIWVTSDGVTWEQVGGPGLGDAHNIMFDLMVFNGELYAVSTNLGGQGFEIWATADGQEFNRREKPGFGDARSTNAVPLVFGGRLILAVANQQTGVQIWVSEDGRSFTQVVSGGIGVPGTVSALRAGTAAGAQAVFQGQLYLGILNPKVGGEIWRTADGLHWEQVAKEGLGMGDRMSLIPAVVFQDSLYVFGLRQGDAPRGFDLLRSGDGLSWETVIEYGFERGKGANVSGKLLEFGGRLYLATRNSDPRPVVPDGEEERFRPQGFRLYVSDDGSEWSQVGEDGFGTDTAFASDIAVHSGTLYLEGIDYQTGNKLWKSADGQRWQMIFHELPRSFFGYGAGLCVFKDHLLWMSNDLRRGVEVWRTDEPITGTSPAGSTTGSTTEDSQGTASGTVGSSETSEVVTTSQPPTAGPADQEGGRGSGAQVATGEGLSGGLLALIIVLAVVAAGALAAVGYLLGRVRGADGVVSTSAAAQSTQAPSFCSECGAALSPSARFCSGCGRQL